MEKAKTYPVLSYVLQLNHCCEMVLRFCNYLLGQEGYDPAQSSVYIVGLSFSSVFFI